MHQKVSNAEDTSELVESALGGTGKDTLLGNEVELTKISMHLPLAVATHSQPQVAVLPWELHLHFLT